MLLFALSAGPAAGLTINWCTADPLTQVYPTAGRVVHIDGTPACAANVSFLAFGPRGHTASSSTAADGTFVLSTFAEDDGAAAGKYSVRVVDRRGNQLALVTTGPGFSKTATVRRGPNLFKIQVQKP
jgi:hypothetical protein